MTFKKRAVAAIVKNNEYPHQESGCQDGETQGEKIGDLQAEVHGHPEEQIWPQGVDDLPDAFPDIGFVISAYYIQPGAVFAFLLFHNLCLLYQILLEHPQGFYLSNQL